MTFPDVTHRFGNVYHRVKKVKLLRFMRPTIEGVMNDSEEVLNNFNEELGALLNRYFTEYDLSLPAAIGLLTVKTHQLIEMNCQPHHDHEY